jgi:hypothetical protein
MRGKGITYDTGFLNAGASTREPFDPEVVKREMRVIREDLPRGPGAVRLAGRRQSKQPFWPAAR